MRLPRDQAGIGPVKSGRQLNGQCPILHQLTRIAERRTRGRTIQ
jgi:hypothetical protein